MEKQRLRYVKNQIHLVFKEESSVEFLSGINVISAAKVKTLISKLTKTDSMKFTICCRENML